MDAIDGLRLALGPSVILNYVLQGLFHPARKVREAYWKVIRLILFNRFMSLTI
jgi:splicing factor 3B subunit 1